MGDRGWISRKRKSEQGAVSLEAGEASGDSSPSSSASAIPASLMPHLGWTRLSSCSVLEAARKRRRARARLDSSNDSGTLGTVAGRALFFVHDARDEPGGATWFQGRFFPASSALPNSKPRSSWGLLAVQKNDVDECLLCSAGGYRELDLTVVRHLPAAVPNQKNPLRWLAESVVWTGGDMMRLSSALSAPPLLQDAGGVEFEPKHVFSGLRATGLAEKYFPSLMDKLKKQDALNTHQSEAKLDFSDAAIIVVGDMKITAPDSFLGREQTPQK